MTLTRVNSNGITEIDKTKISGTAITAADTGTVTSAMIADGQVTSAKIADATIVNQDVSLTAAIEGTKISPNFGSQNVVTTGQLSAAGINYPTSGSLSGRNRIINGDMRIDQRNAGAAVTPADGVYTLDRWRAGASQSSKFSVQRSATAPAGFTNSLLVTSLSAYSVTTNDNFEVFQYIEGFNVADLAWGTANAQSVTVSFWVRSSLTGTFGGTVNNSAFNRSYPFSYTISAANTFEYKTITIAGDTSGTWLTDNSTGLVLCIGLGAGAGRSGTAGAWSGSTFYNATGATSVVGTNGATFYITGVQLEAGTVATPFERRSYGQELALCQRYFCKSFSANTAPANGIYTFNSTSGWEGQSNSRTQFARFPVEMRAAPTATAYGSGGQFQYFNGISWSSFSTTSASPDSTTGMFFSCVASSANPSLHPWYIKGDWTASAEL